jgi:hypothetical protein
MEKCKDQLGQIRLKKEEVDQGVCKRIGGIEEAIRS